MTPSVSNTYYASLEAPRLTTEVPEDNDVLPETVTDSTKPEDVRKPRRKGTNLYGRPTAPVDRFRWRNGDESLNCT
ncbi:hypothetical protein ANCDUO_18133 [Ancylostoma duodenale]|uniref:Uncharacterized protein n=1 Tax=Ancylostoma duodenale TaxID=51022 RepID=A0A0C2FYM1_9BILA|nr:hypothetical protein ANCDUO_18133 [Ancylostoma duodenale]